MTAIQNGLCLHGGLRPYGGTFLVFMEYARNAVRMAALMHQPNILVYTHDSIGLGEDGPTHQPIEQLANLRLTPNMRTWRPCDTVESAVSWKRAVQRQDGPSALIFSRQGLPCMERGNDQLADVEKGGYTLLQTGEGTPDAIIIATGSEVELAVKAAQALSGKNIRVVSMPLWKNSWPRTRAIRTACCPAMCVLVSPWKRRLRITGTASWAWTARSWA